MKREDHDRSSFTRFLLIMRLVVILTLFNITGIFAAGTAQTITLKAQNLSLIQAMKAVQEQSGYSFFLKDKNLAEMKLDVHIKEQDLARTMDLLLADKPAEWVLLGETIVIKPRRSASDGANSGPTQLINQQQVVSGVVTDEQGEVLPGVTVVVKGTTKATTTGADGTYTLTVSSDDPTLVFTSVGYQAIEEVVEARETINVVLKAQIGDLEEVVVVGYGTQKKANLTGAVQSISSEQLMRRTTATASVALQGMVPGLSAMQTSGQPGADDAAIKIRGTGSLNSATAPLVLIDGVEGDMNRIDLNSVESISVLKDAASASIYGSRASNGVILITTKRGKEGKVRISYNGYAGVNTPTVLPDPVSAVEYMEAVNVASANASQAPKYTQEEIELYKNGEADNKLYYNTQWQDEVLKKTAFLQNHSVSLNGGNETTRFFASAGYYFQDGQIQENDFSRVNVRINTDTKIRDWLTAGIDVNIRESHAKRPVMETPVNIIGYALTFNPLLSGRNSDGTYGYGLNGINPIALAEAGGIRNDVAPELGLRAFVNIDPFDGFHISSTYSYRKLDSEMDAFVFPYEMYEGGTFRGTFPSTGSSRAEQRGKRIANQFSLLASYEENLGLHYFKVMAGMQSEELNYKMISARRANFIIRDYNEIFNGDPSTMSNNGDRYDSALLSYLFRVNYAFSDRYLLEINGRYDGSSRFIGDNRWGFFPSVSAGWKISEETFFNPLSSVVSNLKLRASYGLLGNQAISGYYPYTSLVTSGFYYWLDKTLGPGASQTQLANRGIAWEKSKQLNFGVDLGLLDQKLALTFDYYVRDITDMLQRFDLPLFVGMTAPWENAGSMRNKGWDLSVNWNGKINDFSYYITGNLSDVRNEILNLYGNEYIGLSSITREGDPYNSYYGYVSDGIFQSQAEIDAASSVYGGKKENVRPGFIRYKDINGDDVIDTKDRSIIGNPSPRYEYSFTLGGKWRDFDFSVFFQGVGKRDVFYSGPGARPLFGANTTLYKHQLDYWTEDNKDASYPLLLNDVAGTGSNNIVSDFWVRSGSYLRLKNLVLGYTLPSEWTKRATIDKVRFYVSAQNLLTKSNTLKGYDPENSVVSGNLYPLMKTFNFGINLDF